MSVVSVHESGVQSDDWFPNYQNRSMPDDYDTLQSSSWVSLWFCSKVWDSMYFSLMLTLYSLAPINCIIESLVIAVFITCRHIFIIPWYIIEFPVNQS